MPDVQLCGQRLRLADSDHRAGIPVPCARLRDHEGPHRGVTAREPFLAVQWVDITPPPKPPFKERERLRYQEETAAGLDTTAIAIQHGVPVERVRRVRGTA